MAITSARRANSSPTESASFRLLVRHWRGEHGLVLSMLLPCAVLATLWAGFKFAFGSVDWVLYYREAALASLVLILALVCAGVWGAVGVAHRARREALAGAGWIAVHTPVSVVMAVALTTAGNFWLDTGAWTTHLWSIVKGPTEPPELTVSADGTTLQLKGVFDYGTTASLKAYLDRLPQVQRIELESTGGLAAEGLGTGRLIAERELDTVVTEDCASACVTAFAGGNRRLLGGDGRLGLHTSSGPAFDWTPDFDELHARFLQSRGVAMWLIEQELATPNEDIWIPSAMALLDSGLVTDMLEN